MDVMPHRSFRAALLLIAFCSSAGNLHAASMEDALAEQDAALARLHALAKGDGTKATPPDWTAIDAEVDAVIKPSLRLAELVETEPLQQMQLCLNIPKSMDAVGEALVSEHNAASGPTAPAPPALDALIDKSPTYRRLHTHAYLELTRCQIRMLMKDAETWPVEPGPAVDPNRLLGLQLTPYRMFTLALMPATHFKGVAPEERTALVARAIPVAQEYARAVSPEIRANILAATEQMSTQGDYASRVDLKDILDAFRTDECTTISCQRGRGRLEEPQRPGRP